MATASTCACTLLPPRLKRVSKYPATWALVMPVRLLAPEPYRLGKHAANQLPSAVADGPPLKQLISAWPFLLCQKPMPPVRPLVTPWPRLVTVAVSLAVADWVLGLLICTLTA